MISRKGSIFVLYNKSNIDIWNSNANINIGNFDHVTVKQNIGKANINVRKFQHDVGEQNIGKFDISSWI